VSAEPAVDKAALLLLSLGADEAAEVLKHLGPREVQRVGLAMARLQPQARDRVDALLDELEAHCAKGSPIHADETQIRAMLTKALGDERASQLIPRVLRDADSAGIDGLKWMDAASAAELIQKEHPQIIAAILAHLECDQAGDILKHFGERLRNDVILRIATLDGVQPMALKELDAALARMLASAPARRTAMGGVRHAAEILHFVGAAAETAVINEVRSHDPALAAQILDEMHGFEKLLDFDELSLQVLLRAIPRDVMVVALKGAGPDLCDKLFAALPRGGAESLREDLEATGPVSLAAVEAAQQEILHLARRLVADGQISPGGSGRSEAASEGPGPLLRRSP
jgi:flagellar motor switch protein FliG